MTQFTVTRLKLTAWYTLSVLVLSAILTRIYFSRTAMVMENQRQRLGERLEIIETRNGPAFPPPPRNGILQEEFQEARSQIGHQLLIINGAVVLLGAIVSYILSGVTLRPIKEAMDNQQQFISDAAHELKTPIAALKASLEVNLMDKKLTKVTKQILRENLDDVQSLQSLTENLLILARSEENHFLPQAVVLKPVIDQVIKQLQPLAKAKKMSIKLKFPQEKIVIAGESESLKSMVSILLDNAIKYGKTKTPIELSVDQRGQQVALKVSNQGQGIAATDLPHIFERFYRAEKSRTKQGTGGYGLGLSVAKKIIDRHHGSISVTSQPNKITVFTVKLPLYK